MLWIIGLIVLAAGLIVHALGLVMELRHRKEHPSPPLGRSRQIYLGLALEVIGLVIIALIFIL